VVNIAEDAYAGWNTHFIVVKNDPSSDEQPVFPGGCPIRNPTMDAAGALITSLNGIIFVGSVYGAGQIHETYLSLLTQYPNLRGIVFDLDNGEGRYYAGDAAGDPDVFYRLEQIAIGKAIRGTPKVERPVDRNLEMGQMFPASLKAQEYKTDLRLDKIYCDKKKLAALNKDSLVLNQLGFLGVGLVEPNGMIKIIRPDLHPYYLVIKYTRDYSQDPNVVARSWVAPCTKFTSYEERDEVENTVEINLIAEATYGVSLPGDYPNIFKYAPDTVP